jgi:hypothetical protein
MAKKKKDDAVFTLYDDEPNPFEMSEEEYEKAREEYRKKTEVESKKMEAWLKANENKNRQ